MNHLQFFAIFLGTILHFTQGTVPPPDFDVILYFSTYATIDFDEAPRVSYTDLASTLTHYGVNIADYISRNENFLLTRYGLNFTGLPTTTTDGFPYKTIPGVASYFPVVFDQFGHTLIDYKGIFPPTRPLVQIDAIVSFVTLFVPGTNFSGTFGDSLSFREIEQVSIPSLGITGLTPYATSYAIEFFKLGSLRNKQFWYCSYYPVTSSPVLLANNILRDSSRNFVSDQSVDTFLNPNYGTGQVFGTFDQNPSLAFSPDTSTRVEANFVYGFPALMEGDISQCYFP